MSQFGDVEMRKLLTLPGLELQPFGRPAYSHRTGICMCGVCCDITDIAKLPAEMGKWTLRRIYSATLEILI
jgi:hypothetical protein